MKKTLILSVYLLSFQAILAQDLTEVRCESGHTAFSGKVIPGLGFAYIVTDTESSVQDTLLVADYAKSCFCNDTLGVFLTNRDEHPSIEYFKLGKQGWKWQKSIYLPPGFPLVGVLIEGKVFEIASHTLVSTDKLVSDLTIRKVIDSQLVTLQTFAMEYRIDTENGSLFVEKKVLKAD